MAEIAAEKNNIIQTIKSYSRQLFDFIRSRVAATEDAEDILQDVWYQLSNQNSINEIESMSGWLHRVARNKITDSYRKKKSERLDNYINDDELSIENIFLSEVDAIEDKELQQLFWETLFDALSELPQAQREVFILNEMEDKTLQQIADLKGEKLKTIISRKRYAVQHLRKRLEDLYNEFMNY